LIFIELEYRLQAGEAVRVESYLERFPEVAQATEDVVRLIAWEAELLRRSEPGLTVDEYTGRFPQHSGQLLPLLEATLHTPACPAPPGDQPDTAAEDEEASRPVPSAALVELVRLLALLPAEQLDALAALGERGAGFEDLVGEAGKRGWLTEFQIQYLRRGRGHELKIGQYVLLNRLGTGGMGVVYEARPRASDQRVALKVLSKERLQHPDALRRFRREVQAASRLDHPNIVKVFGAWQVLDVHFLVMERIAGLDLYHLVEQAGPLPLDRSCDFVGQAAAGLQHAHEKGLVHRDIKPSNLMVAPATPGQTDPSPATLLSARAVVKILDLGLARIQPSAELAESVTTLTRAGTLMGTPDFMAPEQWEDAHASDIRADLYSLGCTLYYLLTGQVPFPGGTLIQKLDRHRSQPAVPVERLRIDVSPLLAQVVARLLAKRPSERYQTPAEVSDVLARCQRSSRILLRPVIPGSRSTQPPEQPGELVCFQGHTRPVTSLAVGLDGRQLASAAEDGTLRLWEIGCGRELRRLEGHSDAIRSVAFSPDGRRLVSGGADRSLRLFDVNGGYALRKLKGHTDAVNQVGFSPDGRQLLSASSDRLIRLWDATTGRCLLRLEGHSGEVLCAIYSPDGRQVLSSGWDKTVRLWDARLGKELRCFGGTWSAWQWTILLGLAFSPDGRRFAAAGSDQILRLCQIDDGQELAQFTGHTDRVTCVAVSPDGQSLLTGSRDHTVRLWNVATRSERHRFEGHTDAVTSVAFTPDGRCAVSGAADCTLRLWRLPK
jgi:WD40 repeat protein/tRNA A-37 threonylcarbamoyl transferase component Bud32